MTDYFEEVGLRPTDQREPDGDALRACLSVREVQRLLVPHDCVDGFGAAFWARPEAYLDPAVQANISELASLSIRPALGGRRASWPTLSPASGTAAMVTCAR